MKRELLLILAAFVLLGIAGIYLKPEAMTGEEEKNANRNRQIIFDDLKKKRGMDTLSKDSGILPE